MTDLSNTVNDVALQTKLQVDVQIALEDNDAEEPPSPELITTWAQRAYQQVCATADHLKSSSSEVTIRLVGESEMRSLNHQYRGKDSTTNVLSFPFENEFDGIAEIALGLLGDVVICHAVIVNESQQQNKTAQHHYAHMVTHGILHLCGYDHQQTSEANAMEALETLILAQSGIANPYQ